MRDLVEKVAVEMGVVIADYVNPETDFSKALRIGAKAAIATVLRELRASTLSPLDYTEYIEAFAAEHGIALDRALAPSGEGEEK